ncbi:maleylpyruvate isomerase family mycothiol-dependent enzyme [Streptomyces sp. NPDC088387]|uniref:maleylpyruvate isomerase family mycothiol-dependent enzyme n=1 Tax=Streptomyces sp. NPDC088387 TaxID=3365859 RepID=UPI003808F92A
MTRWILDRYCSEILSQTELLRALLRDGDPRAPVPTCPEWNLGRLVRHVGGTHRWAEEVVRTRATEPVPDDLVNNVFGYGDEDPAALDEWLGAGARLLTTALMDAGPDARVWTPPEPDQPVVFWARRMLHETSLHRADAAWTVGVPYEVDTAVARDALDEWMAFGTVPEAYDEEDAEPLLGPGRTLRFRAVDSPTEVWGVDLTGAAPTWSHSGRGDAAVTVTGTLTDLMLLVYGRPVAPRIEVDGDGALLDLWLRRTRFWLN